MLHRTFKRVLGAPTILQWPDIVEIFRCFIFAFLSRIKSQTRRVHGLGARPAAAGAACSPLATDLPPHLPVILLLASRLPTKDATIRRTATSSPLQWLRTFVHHAPPPSPSLHCHCRGRRAATDNSTYRRSLAVRCWWVLLSFIFLFFLVSIALRCQSLRSLRPETRRPVLQSEGTRQLPEVTRCSGRLTSF